MNKGCIFLCLLTFSGLLFSQKGFPSKNYEKVLINRLNGGYEKPAAYAGVALKPHHIRILNELIQVIHESKSATQEEFTPDTGIYFYNDSDEEMACLLFSESKERIMLKENKSAKTIIASETVQHKLFDIITETLWEFKPVIPSSADSVVYTVPENKTWEQIADSFQTSIALICEINHCNKDWGLNPGRTLIVIPGVKEFRYQAPAIRQHERIRLENGQSVILHTVRKRESLYTLSGIYNIPIEKIVSFNNLNTYVLSVGQLIYIPNN
ncbi:MAG: LysM peptidoglycan-binding domain-containing protein [Bacteroidia bacterium]|nr:LysM peptidoglycan-binding domain-containing protein [Bacteroidia bacterium]